MQTFQVKGAGPESERGAGLQLAPHTAGPSTERPVCNSRKSPSRYREEAANKCFNPIASCTGPRQGRQKTCQQSSGRNRCSSTGSSRSTTRWARQGQGRGSSARQGPGPRDRHTRAKGTRRGATSGDIFDILHAQGSPTRLLEERRYPQGKREGRMLLDEVSYRQSGNSGLPVRCKLHIRPLSHDWQQRLEFQSQKSSTA